MSDRTTAAQDFPLKLRLMRYLWYQGYHVRKNVDVFEGWQGGKQYTDVDVLGIKIDAQLSSSTLIGDCKSGKVSNRERLLWISGLMKYLDAESGILFRPNISIGDYLENAGRLGITVLSDEMMLELEKAYDIPGDRYFGPFCKEQENSDKIWGLVKEFEPNIYRYVLSGLWQDIVHEQIRSLALACRRLSSLDGISDDAKSFATTFVLSELSLAILRFSKDILRVTPSKRPEHVQYGLLGGRLGFDEKRGILKSFHDFMTKEIAEKYKANYPMNSSQFLDSALPDYSKYLADLVIRYCERPTNSIVVPRVLDLVAFESILNQRSPSLQDAVLCGLRSDRESIMKPVQEFLSFVERSEILTPSLANELKNRIDDVN